MGDQERQELVAIVGADDSIGYIRRRMQEVGVSASRLARHMSLTEGYDVSDETMRRWLRGEGEPDLSDLKRIAASLAEIDSAKASFLTPDVRGLVLRPIYPPSVLQRRRDSRLAPIGAAAA